VNYQQFLTESKKVQVKDFANFVKDYLELSSLPEIIVIDDPNFSKENKTFACFNLANDQIKIQVAQRHPLDVYRSLAHELVHYHQKCNGQEMNGETGSDCENEANAMAGEILRNYTRTIPNHGY
jgi:Zn-dependent peptidase ImmA (M78 family)